MKTIFDVKKKLSTAKAYTYPFKHILIENFLPEDLYLKSEKMFNDEFFKSKIDGQKKTDVTLNINLSSDQEIIQYGIKNYAETFQMLNFFKTNEFHKTLHDLFGDSLIKIYEKGTRSKKLTRDYYSSLKLGNYGLSKNLKNSSESNPDLNLDTSIKCGINMPSFGEPKSVRDIHIDNPTKLFNALLYFRQEEDDYAGGDLILYRFKEDKIKLHSKVYASHKDCVISKVVPYKRNTLILFINSPNSLHGVVERSNVPLERRYINISSSFKYFQFEISKFQDKKKNFLKKPLTSLKNFIKNTLN